MSKQMHRLDDGENPGRGAFWQRKQAHQQLAPQSEPSSESEKRASTSKNNAVSGQDEDGMGKQNPFENWRINATPHQQKQLPKPDRVAVRGTLRLIWQVISTVVLAGVIAATLFSLWMPGNFMPGELERKVVDAVAADEQVTQTEVTESVLPANFPLNKIGIIVGHRGHDSGAVCANGLTELEINSNVATYVQQMLIDAGFEVELLDEFDARLKNYEAGLLLSIHSDSCHYIDDSATGFKVAAAFSQKADQSSTRLVQCLSDRYAKRTGLRYHYQSITTEMTSYHAFNEVSPYTTAGIIELGFMNLDQEILTTRPELLAEGIVEGIVCYMNNEEVEQP